jgi:hypothetical protein
VAPDGSIPALADDLLVAHQQRTDRDLAGRLCPPRELEGALHVGPIVLVRHSHSIINKPFLSFIFIGLFSC